MTVMFIIAGLILGLGMFLMIRRSWKKADAKDDMKGRVAPCPGCKLDLVVSNSWVRSGLRGEFFTCKPCGRRSLWDFDREPPILKR